jgi:hypothetical protein
VWSPPAVAVALWQWLAVALAKLSGHAISTVTDSAMPFASMALQCCTAA